MVELVGKIVEIAGNIVVSCVVAQATWDGALACVVHRAQWGKES